MSGKDFLKSYVLSWRRKVYNWEDVTSSGRAFQVLGPATGKARLPTVDRLTVGTRRRLEPEERSDRLPGRLCTGTSGPRYGGAFPRRTLNVSRAILYSIRSATHSQWRVASASVMWSADRRWKINQARPGAINCRFLLQLLKTIWLVCPQTAQLYTTALLSTGLFQPQDK